MLKYVTDAVPGPPALAESRLVDDGITFWLRADGTTLPYCALKSVVLFGGCGK